MIKLEVDSRHKGYCPICEKDSVFYIGSEWLRDTYICTVCWSTPRQRALTLVLKMLYPNYRDLIIHESSPDGANSEKLQLECSSYTSSQYFLDTPLGAYKDGVRCESVEQLTFSDEEIDLFVTQDVFEHVMNPLRGFQEVARVLKPNGSHIFTVPRLPDKPTKTRVKKVDGQIIYLMEKEYHQNPIDPEGSLVVTTWGSDMEEIIKEQCGLNVYSYNIIDRYFGIDGECLDVFVIRKEM